MGVLVTGTLQHLPSTQTWDGVKDYNLHVSLGCSARNAIQNTMSNLLTYVHDMRLLQSSVQ